jgi:hypothetical protein
LHLVTQEEEKLVRLTEEPGLDGVRATLGLGAIGSFIRARRRKSIIERAESLRSTQSVNQYPAGSNVQNGKRSQAPQDISEKISGLPSTEAPLDHGRLATTPISQQRSRQSYFPPMSNTEVSGSDHKTSANSITMTSQDVAPQVPNIIPHTPLTPPTPIRESNTTKS